MSVVRLLSVVPLAKALSSQVQLLHEFRLYHATVHLMQRPTRRFHPLPSSCNIFYPFIPFYSLLLSTPLFLFVFLISLHITDFANVRTPEHLFLLFLITLTCTTDDAVWYTTLYIIITKPPLSFLYLSPNGSLDM